MTAGVHSRVREMAGIIVLIRSKHQSPDARDASKGAKALKNARAEHELLWGGQAKDTTDGSSQAIRLSGPQADSKGAATHRHVVEFTIWMILVSASARTLKRSRFRTCTTLPARTYCSSGVLDTEGAITALPAITRNV